MATFWKNRADKVAQEKQMAAIKTAEEEGRLKNFILDGESVYFDPYTCTYQVGKPAYAFPPPPKKENNVFSSPPSPPKT